MNPTITPMLLPNRDGLIVMGRKFSCSLCEKTFTQYNSYDEHYMADHVCATCWCVEESLNNHKDCLPAQWGAGSSLGIPLDERDFQSGPFTMTQNSHEGSTLIFEKKLSLPFISVESAFETHFEILRELLIKLTKQMLGIRVKIAIEASLEKRSTLARKEGNYGCPYTTLLYPSPLLVETLLITAANYITASINLNNQDGSFV